MLKGFGIGFLVLGSLLMVLGLGAVAEGGAAMRYLVFPGATGDAVVEQPFHARFGFS